jgi:hypothetical protein
MSEEVGTLQDLILIAEDVIDDEQSLRGIFRAGDIWRGTLLAT